MNLTAPINNLVTQRSRQNRAAITVSGTIGASSGTATTAGTGVVTTVRVRLVPINGGTTTGWLPATLTGSAFSAIVIAQGGWYRLDVEGLNNGGAVVESATVAHVGVGEVFLVTGHSVMEGDATYTLPGTDDERVIAVPFTFNNSAFSNTGNPADLPLNFSPYTTGVKPGPTGGTTHFWAKFGQTLTARLGVPVLVLNAAIGGTTLNNWATTAQGGTRPLFSFDPALKFPYTAIKASLLRYILPLTGCRAVLVDLGQNDRDEPSEDVLFGRYMTLIGQIRAEAGFATLPVIINRQTPDITRPNALPFAQIRRMQERTLAASPDNVAGPDYDTALTLDDRYDYIHLNVSGQTKAASLWASVLTDAVLRNTTPLVVDATLRADTAPPVPSTTTPAASQTRPLIDLGQLDSRQKPVQASILGADSLWPVAAALLLTTLVALLFYAFNRP